MKKLLTLLIVAALATSMVACSSGDKSSSAASSSSSVTDSVTDSSKVEDSASEAPSFEVSAENKALGDIITAARAADFNEAFPIIMSAEDPAAKMIFEVAGLKAEDMASYAVSISAINTHAYGVAVVKPAAGKEEAVMTAINAFVENQKKAFEQYLPDQKEIANAAIVEKQADGTIVLVMSEGAKDVHAKIVEGLKAIPAPAAVTSSVADSAAATSSVADSAASK